jgi:thiol-disulfide isomerase/thioredoxin
MNIFGSYEISCPDQNCGGNALLEFVEKVDEDNALFWAGFCPKCDREINIMSEIVPPEAMAQA